MIQKGQTVPTFDAVAFKEPTDKVSAPVKSTYGYHLIEALGPVTPASDPARSTPPSRPRSRPS